MSRSFVSRQSLLPTQCFRCGLGWAPHAMAPVDLRRRRLRCHCRVLSLSVWSRLLTRSKVGQSSAKSFPSGLVALQQDLMAHDAAAKASELGATGRQGWADRGCGERQVSPCGDPLAPPSLAARGEGDRAWRRPRPGGAAGGGRGGAGGRPGAAGGGDFGELSRGDKGSSEAGGRVLLLHRGAAAGGETGDGARGGQGVGCVDSSSLPCPCQRCRPGPWSQTLLVSSPCSG